MGKNIININDYRSKDGGEKMGIGSVLRERMDCFDMTKDKLCEEALINSDELEALLADEIKYNEIDEVTLSFISQVLYCKPEYFIHAQYRKDDLISSSLNRGASTPKSNEIKGILQSFSEDFCFIMELKSELKEETLVATME